MQILNSEEISGLMTQPISRSALHDFTDHVVIGDQNNNTLWHQIDWNRAITLRRMVITSNSGPMYLLAPEVSALLWYLEDLRQLAYFSTLWNTGARPNEGLALTRQDFDLNDIQPFVGLRTLKQRNRGRGRPGKNEAVKRTIPLFDSAYTKLIRQLFASFPQAKSAPIWPESHDTVGRWLKRAVDRAARDGVTFSLPVINPKTFRHSFAVHLLYNRVHERELQELMGHQCAESTQVYTRIFTLDVAAGNHITFSFDSQTAVEALRLGNQNNPTLLR